jgi:acetyl-CoA carboxylase biotin carboxylase subunit
MQRALDMLVVEGIKTTIPLHKKIMADPAFQRGEFSTKFMEEFGNNEKLTATGEK